MSNDVRPRDRAILVGILMLVGGWLVWSGDGWRDFAGVTFMIWANNVSLRLPR